MIPPDSAFSVSVPDVTLRIAERRAVINKGIADFRGTDVIPSNTGRSLHQIAQDIAALKEKSKLTEAKKKDYEKFLLDRQKLEELIASITREIDDLDKSERVPMAEMQP